MDLLGALGVLVRVVETGSFSAVARERNVSQAAVARQIGQLEAHFGLRLLHRSTRKLSLTDDGQMLLGYARPILDGVDGMEAALGRQSSSPAGLVRVAVPVAATRFLAPRLPALLAQHPGLKVELVVGDRSGDMIEDRLDLAMRGGDVADASLVVRRAGISRRITVATPAYLASRGAPNRPEDLIEHLCLVHNNGPDAALWTFTSPGGVIRVDVSGSFIADDSSAIHLAARHGHGIAHLPQIEVFDDVREGRLVPLLSDYPSPPVPVNLVYPSRRHLAPRTRVVLDFVLEQIRETQVTLAQARQH